MRRHHAVIFIYTFPPMGGPGVQRAVKFGKYLPRSGWDVTFVTVKDVLYHIYDHTLASTLSPDTEVVRTGSADPLRVAYLLKKLRGSPAIAIGAAAPKKKTESAAKARVLKIYRALQSWMFVVDPQILWMPFAVLAGVRTVKAHPWS